MGRPRSRHYHHAPQWVAQQHRPSSINQTHTPLSLQQQGRQPHQYICLFGISGRQFTGQLRAGQTRHQVRTHHRQLAISGGDRTVLLHQRWLSLPDRRLPDLYSGPALRGQHPSQIGNLLVLPLKRKASDTQRGLATSLMVGANILGSGIGFAIPTLVVSEDGD